MCELHLKILPMCRIETLLYRLINVCFLSHLFPLLIATLSAPLVMWRHPDKAPQRKCGMQTVKGAAGQLPMEQEQVGRPAETVLLIPPRHRSNTNAGVDITAIWMDLPTTVYSRLLSAMCSRLAVGPDRPPSSSSSSPAVWCWNSSLDSSPELEDLSSFWMSLLGSAGASRNRQTCQNVDYMVLKSVIINDLKSAMCGSYSAVIKHLRKSSQMETWYIDINLKKNRNCSGASWCCRSCLFVFTFFRYLFHFCPAPNLEFLGCACYFSFFTDTVHKGKLKSIAFTI